MESIVLLGIGGHAHSVVDSIEAGKKYSIYGFLDVEEKRGEKYRGYEVLGADSLLETYFENGIRNAFVSVGYLGMSDIRNRLYRQLKAIGYELPNIIDKTAIIAEDVELGEGIFIGKGAVVNSAAQIGNMCIINTKAIVEHDCVVGNFSHVAVGGILCGNVQVGESSFVGANATVIQGKKLGNNCIIGAGITIRENVADNDIIRK